MKGSRILSGVSESWMTFSNMRSRSQLKPVTDHDKSVLDTLITAGKRSRCMKYVNKLVWYAPEATASAASTALFRRSTASRQSPPRMRRSTSEYMLT